MIQVAATPTACSTANTACTGLVRISPFNNEGKRQTAFSAMQVAPFFEAMADEVDIDEKDLRIDTYRSSGAPVASTST